MTLVRTWNIVVVGLGTLLGCDRQLPFDANTSSQPISGYQLEGYVTDRLGTPVRGLRIALWYDYYYLDNTPAASRVFNIDDSSKVSMVQVLNQKNVVERVLYQARSKPGPLSLAWDKTDSLGRPVPSGIYTVLFTEGGVVKGSYPSLVDGAVSAVTDSLGHYVIAGESFPVGFFPVPLYSNSTGAYVGNYQIAEDVRLEFYTDPHHSAILTMSQDVVTRFNYSF